MHQRIHQTVHRTRRLPPYAIVTMTALILGLSGPVFADDEGKKVIVEAPRKRLSSDTVTRLDNLPETEPNWFRANIHTAKKHGFEFSRSYMTKDREKIIFNVKGPIISKKTAGLTFEIRF